MDMQRMQAQVGRWAEHNFSHNNTIEACGLGLGEEAGEALRAILKRSQKIRGTYEEWTRELQKELADVFIKLCHAAELEGIDLEDVILTRWIEVKNRDFQANPTGHGLPEE